MNHFFLHFPSVSPFFPSSFFPNVSLCGAGLERLTRHVGDVGTEDDEVCLKRNAMLGDCGPSGL